MQSNGLKNIKNLYQERCILLVLGCIVLNNRIATPLMYTSMYLLILSIKQQESKFDPKQWTKKTSHFDIEQLFCVIDSINIIALKLIILSFFSTEITR
jgi:hypothetical protein